MIVMGIDDSITMRKILAMSIQDHYQFIEAENGEDGLKKLKNFPAIDCFIVDINMPILSGIDFIKEVRKLRQYAKTPIIVVTTETEQNLVDEGLKAGAQAWLQKPFEKEVLLSKIKELTKN